MPYPDLQVDIESDSGTLVIEAEWRENIQQWVADYDDFKMRLWPESAAKKGVDYNGFLFNIQNERVYKKAYRKLVVAARKHVNE